MSIAELKKIGTDKLRRDYILPRKVLWATEGISNVESLLTNEEYQARQSEGELVIASTRGGRKAAFLLDFGSEFSGGVRIVTRVGTDKQGAMVHLRFGESVAEAMTPLTVKNAVNHHSTRDMVVPIPLLSTTEWSQTGFRFLYVEVETPEVYLEFISIHGIFTYRDIPYLGTFECNDKRINDIYNTSAYTVHLNMQNYIWDGIKRDRLVWIGDMHPEMLAIRTVFGYQPVLDDSLRYVAKTDPMPKYPNNMTTYGMWYLMILRDWYFHNGKIELVEELKGYWLQLLKQLLGLVHDEYPILVEEELMRGFFFDWPTQGMNEASGAAIYALLSETLKAGITLCEGVGEATVAEECKRKIELLQDNRNHHYNMKQVIAMMNLAGHICDEEAATLLTRDGGRGMSTFQSYYILKAAARSAGVASALDMMSEYYGGMLDAGATSFWEDFDLDWLKDGARIDTLLEDGEYDIHGDNGRFCYVGLRHSLCHGWSAGPAAFLAEDVLGINILSPGCKEISITPNLGNLEWAKGTYPTPFGIISVEVKRVEEGIDIKMNVPKEITVVNPTSLSQDK